MTPAVPGRCRAFDADDGLAAGREGLDRATELGVDAGRAELGDVAGVIDGIAVRVLGREQGRDRIAPDHVALEMDAGRIVVLQATGVELLEEGWRRKTSCCCAGKFWK